MTGKMIEVPLHRAFLKGRDRGVEELPPPSIEVGDRTLIAYLQSKHS